MSLATPRRSRGELTSVWSRSKTQTGAGTSGRCGHRGNGVHGCGSGALTLEVEQEISQHLDAAVVEPSVTEDQLDVAWDAAANAIDGLFGTHHRAGSLEHA